MITLYEAEKQNKGVITRMALGLQTKKKPVPLYFHKLKDGTYMINDDSPAWKNYIELRRIKKTGSMLKDDKFQRLLKAVIAVILERYSPSLEELKEITQDITDRSGIS